jgi:predicted TIM-barrel fold metal-dependent hydrolase
VFRVPHVDTRPLEAIVRKLPRLKLGLTNAFRALRPEQVAPLTNAGQVYVELAMLKGAAGVARLLDVVSPQRVLFGSHFPLFYYESAVLKLQESGLPAAQLRAIREENVRRLLPS